MAAKSDSKVASGPPPANGARPRTGKFRAQPKRNPWVRRAKLIAVWTAVILCAIFVIGGIRFYQELLWAESVLPKLDSYMRMLAANPTVIVDTKGEVLYRAQLEYRKPLKFADIPKHVRDATLAAEDIRFYDHQGVDMRAVFRAIFTNVREGKVSQGGSTLTMQLAKRLYTGPERRIQRKLKDMALAVQIERTHTKDQIITLYLNQVYYGAGAYGIGAAASVYFNKQVKDLTLAEAALLARLVQRPSEENPFLNPDAAVKNRDVVLQRMHDAGMIKKAELDEAMAQPLKLQPKSFASGSRSFKSPYFVDYVLDELKSELPGVDVTKGGYRIETTIDAALNKVAEMKIKEVIKSSSRQGVTTGAFVLMDYEGRIRAMVGGVDYDRNQFNTIAQGPGRQPGSGFKPFVYAAALSTGAIGPNDMISNEQLTIEDPPGHYRRWPKNYDPVYGGSYTVEYALKKSINVCAAHVCQLVGPDTVVRYAHDVFGFRSRLDPVISIALGSSAVKPLEMAQAYSVFMLNGDRAKPWGIKRVIGPDGEVVKEFGPEVTRGVLDPRIAYEMNEFLRAVVTSGTGYSAHVIANARGKTGTTSDHRDAWFNGYTNSLVGIGWVASEKWNDKTKSWDYEPMNRVTGGRVTIQIWVTAMQEALKMDFYKEQERMRSQNDEPPLVQPIPSGEVSPYQEPGNNDAFPSDIPPIEPGGGTGGPGDVTPKEPPGPHKEQNPPSQPGPDKPPGQREEPIPMVTVQICADSGLLATSYCPETVERRYPRGEEPKRRCPLHGP